jgi:hypothetical protein
VREQAKRLPSSRSIPTPALQRKPWRELSWCWAQGERTAVVQEHPVALRRERAAIARLCRPQVEALAPCQAPVAAHPQHTTRAVRDLPRAHPHYVTYEAKEKRGQRKLARWRREPAEISAQKAHAEASIAGSSALCSSSSSRSSPAFVPAATAAS